VESVKFDSKVKIQGEKCRKGCLEANRTQSTPGFTWVQKEVFCIQAAQSIRYAAYTASPHPEAIYEMVPARKGSLPTNFAHKNNIVLYSETCQTHFMYWTLSSHAYCLDVKVLAILSLHAVKEKNVYLHMWLLGINAHYLFKIHH